MMTGVSFVVSVYNKEPYLAPMLASLAAQRGDFPREFIFVDDGSTDGSVEAIKGATAGWENVRILSQENQGPAIALNTGFAVARHPYIMLLDADDLLAPYATELLVHEAETRDCGIIHGDGDWVDDPKNATFDTSPGPIDPQMIDLQHVVKFFHCGSSGVLLRNDTARQAGGCDDRVFVQEHSLFLRMARVAPVIRIAPVLSLAPRHVEGRIMENRGDMDPGMPLQTIHDRMTAVGFFLADNTDLPPALASTALKNCATDLWKWLHREGHAETWGKALGWLWLSRLRYGLKNNRISLVDEAALIGEMAAVIRRHAPIRLTDAGKAAVIAQGRGVG